MKKPIAVVAIAALLLSSFAFADDAHHPQKPTDKKAAGKTVKPAPSDQQMMAMRDQMRKMRETMEKIQNTTDPTERQKLMKEHMKMMEDGIKMMPMGSAGGMKMGMMGGSEGAKGGDDGDPESCSMTKDHGTMGKRMDMMQMMMEQMMDHQNAVENTAK